MKPLWPNWYVAPGARMPTPMLVEYVARQFRTTSADLLRPDRCPRSVRSRAALIYALHLRGSTPAVIGRIVKRDRQSVRNAIRQIPTYARCPDFAAVVARIDLLPL